MDHYLAFDIGGTAIKYAIGKPGGDMLLFSSIPTPTASLHDFLASLHDLVRLLMKKHPVTAIGLATPGTIDRRSGRLRGVNPNLPWWVDIDPLEAIPQEYRELAVCDNDANLMCLAEASETGAYCLGITVGTGIGSGFVIDGKIYHGSRGFALEAGHICMEKGGLPCNCGLKGCLEAYSSVTAVRKAAQVLDPQFATCELSRIIHAAATNSALAKIILRAEEYLGIALANVSMILDPDEIIIGGGAMDAGLYDIRNIEALVRKHSQSAFHHSTIRNARTGNMAGVMGAMILAAQSHSAG